MSGETPPELPQWKRSMSKGTMGACEREEEEGEEWEEEEAVEWEEEEEGEELEAEVVAVVVAALETGFS